ncbi:EcsC family protein [Pedobacter sp. HMF7647]|uniref:EcsC family protein n=2 Tax=Hufsiella arboris TaxID=2695275 RepID=A0A7K1Y832_9SPHI|nr:EcsC family protein [Hufsiella arboris]
MTAYEEQAFEELKRWQAKMEKRPSLFNRAAKGLQTKINNLIPEKVHKAITLTIEKMTKAVLYGAKYTTFKTAKTESLQISEAYIKDQINFYQRTATVEGAVTGAGGILLGLADFPILIGIKIKLLFDIAAFAGCDVKDYKERLYILYVFQLAFCSQQRRIEIYKQHIENWETYAASLPADVDQFDWRTFQQEYRDYIDLAKMAQLVPVIGAAVGAIANYKLIEQLGNTAINCYRMRWFSMKELNG